MRWRLDRSVRRPRPGLLVGGSPLRLFRLTPAGEAVVDRLTSGPSTPVGAEVRLVDRLVDAGALHPEPEPGGTEDAPGPDAVTVVVPVRDRAGGLDRLLASLAVVGAQDRPAGVVVVDDGSADPVAIAEVAARWGALLVHRARSGGPGPARDEGIRAAATPFVAVVDSDCTVTPGWLGPLLAHLGDGRVAAVAARVRARPGAGLLHVHDALRSPLDLGNEPGRVAPRTRVAYVPAAAMVLRVAAYREVGGFDPEFRTGEDVDLVWRWVEAGWRVRYEPAAEVLHDVRPAFGAWLRQRFDYGATAAALDRRHPGAVAPVSCSPWSAAGWALAAAGRPVAGGAVLAGSAAALPRRLPDVPLRESLRLVASGHLGAGRLLARAVVRVWWPVALPAAVVSRRARRMLAVAVASVLSDAVRGRRAGTVEPDAAAGCPAPVFAALALLDDVAYGAGVWWGCWRERSWRALRPDLTAWPRPADQVPPSSEPRARRGALVEPSTGG